MFYRSSVILARWTWGSGAQVKPIDINLTQPISRLTISIELVNSSYTAVDHPVKSVKGVTVCDGGDNLFSMDGGAAQALSFYGTGKQPHSLISYINNDSARLVIPVDFGRFLFDKLYALDPRPFENLQLKLDIDRSLGACSPDGAYITVSADIFDEKVPSLVGFMMGSEVKSYLPVDDGSEDISMPRDYPYRLMIIKACAEEEGACVQCEDFKLSEDHDKHVIVDERTEQYIERITALYDDWCEYVGVRGLTGGNSYYITPTHNAQAVGNMNAYADHYIALPWAGGQLRKAYHSGGGDINAWCQGQCPHGAIPILFGNRDDPEDFWNPSGLKNLNLHLHSRATDVCDQTDTRTKIIVQQIKSY